MRRVWRRFDDDVRRRELLQLPGRDERVGPVRQRLRVSARSGFRGFEGRVPQRQRPELLDWSRLREQRVFFSVKRRVHLVLQLVRGRVQLCSDADVRVQPERLRAGWRTALHQVRRGLDRAASWIDFVLVPVALGLLVERCDQHVPLPDRHARRQRHVPQCQRAGVHRWQHVRVGTVRQRRLRSSLRRRHRLWWALHLSCGSGEVLWILRGR